MLTYAEKREVNLPADRVYHLLMYSFTNQPLWKELDVRVKRCLEPSHIEVRFGGWGARYGHATLGIAKINILSRDGKSQIEFNLYFKTFVIWWGAFVALGITFIWMLRLGGFGLGTCALFLLIALIALLLSIDAGRKGFMNRVTPLFAGIEAGATAKATLEETLFGEPN